MLKREKQDCILQGVNLYHRVWSADFSQHINLSGETRRDLQKLSTKCAEKIISQQSINIPDYSITGKFITELSPVDALLQPNNETRPVLYYPLVNNF
jgi:hypothetical protein